jgi:hypothetical protein
MGPVTATGQGSFLEPWYWRGKKPERDQDTADKRLSATRKIILLVLAYV